MLIRVKMAETLVLPLLTMTPEIRTATLVLPTKKHNPSHCHCHLPRHRVERARVPGGCQDPLDNRQALPL